MKKNMLVGDLPDIYIWDIISGPYHRSQFSASSICDLPSYYQYAVEVKVQEGDIVKDVLHWFGTEEHAYSLVKYFKVNIGPVKVR